MFEATNDTRYVIVLHENGNKCLFYVEYGHWISAGEAVICKTKKGNVRAVALCDEFCANERQLDVIMKAFETNSENMKPIIGVTHDSYFKSYLEEVNDNGGADL